MSNSPHKLKEGLADLQEVGRSPKEKPPVLFLKQKGK